MRPNVVAVLRVARARRARRGVAVMVVVLVLAMMMGIGLFAARSSILSTSAAGFERQMTQTHYVAQYAVLAATGELATTRTAAYVQQMALYPDQQCTGGPGIYTAVQNYTCYRFGFGDLQNMLGASFFPGAASLGQGGLEGDWMVEMTDLAPSAPVAGMDVTSAGASNLQFMSVTLTATGQVRPFSTGDALTQLAATSASLETTRAHLIVGPLPKL